MLSKKYARLAHKIASPQESSIKSIIFDMEGVLFSVSRLKQIGIILLIVIKHPSLIYVLLTKNIRHEFLTMLEKVPAHGQNKPMFNQNTKIPPILVDWMTGRNQNDLFNSTISCISKSTYSTGEKALFCSIVESLFSPEKFIQSVRPIKNMQKLAYALKSKGYNIYILSNWDAQSFPFLVKKHQSFFNIFNGYLISGTEGIGKPDLQFYKNLLQKYDLEPSQTIFIDDEQQNINAANSLGIKSILQSSFLLVCKQLKQIGIMK